MKFGSTIEANTYEPWRSAYLEYGALKKLISLIASALELERGGKGAAEGGGGGKGDGGGISSRHVERDQIEHKLRHKIYADKWDFLLRGRGADADDSNAAAAHTTVVTSSRLKQYFLHVLDNELTKIATFVQETRANLASEWENLAAEAARRQGRATSASAAAAFHAPTAGRARANLEQAHVIMSRHAGNITDVQRLATFVELNYTGFFKILKKFDKKAGGSAPPDDSGGSHASTPRPPGSSSPPRRSQTGGAADGGPALAAFMSRVDRAQLLRNSMRGLSASWSQARMSVARLRQRQSMLQEEISSAYRIARKALRKLAPARTRQELDKAMQGMGDRTASSNTDGTEGSGSDG